MTASGEWGASNGCCKLILAMPFSWCPMEYLQLLAGHIWSSVHFWALHPRKTLAYWGKSSSQGLDPIIYLLSYKTTRLTGVLIAVCNYPVRDAEQRGKLFLQRHTLEGQVVTHKQEHVKFQYRQEIFHHDGDKHWNKLPSEASAGHGPKQPALTGSGWAGGWTT